MDQYTEITYDTGYQIDTTGCSSYAEVLQRFNDSICLGDTTYRIPWSEEDKKRHKKALDRSMKRI